MPPQVVFRESRDIGAILSAPEDTLRPGEGGATIAPIVGEQSFMLADGDAHLAGRKATLANFNSRVVDQHAAMIGKAARRMLAAWPEDLAIPLHDPLRALTLEVILRTLTGHLGDAFDPPLARLHRQVLEMLTITASPMFVESRLRHGPGKRVWTRFVDRRRQVDEMLFTLIQNHTLRSLRGNAFRHDNVPTARDDIMSLILAGHETTAAQLAWAFQLLAHHPAVCERLHEEIDEGTSDAYLTATIQEVLRHRCVFVFAIPRAVAKPVNIGGRLLGPPAHLLPCIYLLHHDPTIYPDPHTFRPERFLEAPPDPRRWIPWGGGRRRCPGLHLAMLEMKTVLRTVLATRTVHPAAERIERPRWRSVIVAPHAGCRVVFKPR